MKLRDKDEVTKEMIEELHKRSFGNKSKFWKAVARGLNRPRRVKYEVNLLRLEKCAKPKETIVVPGAVLGTGEIKKKLTVAAMKFSATAKEKIEKAGGTCLSINELCKKNPEGKGIKIMG